uniref:SWIM-type domain-containing protein n=1 Tax=Ascaris lumbricoides TaxID=6252 RepID=A0A0M3HIY7_ASCLU
MKSTNDNSTNISFDCSLISIGIHCWHYMNASRIN